MCLKYIRVYTQALKNKNTQLWDLVYFRLPHISTADILNWIVCAVGLYCASCVHSTTCPRQQWQTHLQTWACTVGTRNQTSGAESHWPEWDPGVIWFWSLTGVLLCVLPKTPDTCFIKVSLSQAINVTRWSEGDFVCLVSTRERVQREVSTNSPSEDSPLVKLLEYKWLQGKMLIF